MPNINKKLKTLFLTTVLLLCTCQLIIPGSTAIKTEKSPIAKAKKPTGNKRAKERRRIYREKRQKYYSDYYHKRNDSIFYGILGTITGAATMVIAGFGVFAYAMLQF